MKAAALLAASLLAIEAQAETGTVKATWEVTSDWGTACQAKVVVRNHAAWTIPDWRVSLDLGAFRVSSVWDARMVDSTPGKPTLAMVRADWASPDLAPGDSLVFSLGIAPGACVDPQSIRLNGQELTFGSESPAPAALAPVAAPAWPKSFVAPYVDATLYPTFDLVAAAQSGLRHFTLAFVVAKSAAEPIATWGTYYSTSGLFLLSQINALRRMGGDVMVSFGGASNTELAGSTTNLDTLVEAYDKVVKLYGLAKIDFDIEGVWVADKPSIERRSQALARLQSRWREEGRKVSIWYTLPALPGGLDGNGLRVLESAVDNGVELEGINLMAMDYGDAAAPHPADSMGGYAITAARGLFSQIRTCYLAKGVSKADAEIWSMVGLTPMIGLNDILTERFTLANAREVAAFALEKRIGMLGFWSANRDAPCAGGRTSQVELTCSSEVQDSSEYARTFLPLEERSTGIAAASRTRVVGNGLQEFASVQVRAGARVEFGMANGNQVNPLGIRSRGR